MDIKEFSENVLRIEQSKMFPISGKLLHGILGIADESGELIKIVKDRIYYDQVLDWDNLKEELGDLWYFFTLILIDIAENEGRDIGDIYDEVMRMNVAKLKVRYPNGFTEERALNRDKAAEKEAMEKSKTNS